MTAAKLEHVNFTVPDPLATAKLLCELFGWHIRWQGASAMGGHSVHVGTDDAYLAIYSPDEQPKPRARSSYEATGGLNHIGVEVEDLDAVERRIVEKGFETYSHADYEPGRRFYFRDRDGIEFEVVSYAG